MDIEQEKILSLLEQGTISAAEADELMTAMDDADEKLDESFPVTNPPDMSRFRANWKLPFNVSMALVSLGSIFLLSSRKGRRGPLQTLRLIAWPITLLAALAAIISYWSKDAPWLHIRVQEQSGTKIAISLPLPLQPLKSGLRVARQWIDDQSAAEKLDAASELLDAVDTQNIGDPLMIDVNDGDSVQVFIG